MDRLVVETSHGTLYLVGRLHAGSARPTLLVVTGAFPPRDYRHEIIDDYPGVNVLVGSLPGMDAPFLNRQSQESYSAAFDEMIARLAPRDPLIAYGISTGSLVTLGMKSPNLRHHIVEEPFDSTVGLWPVVDNFRKNLVLFADNPWLRDFLWNLFGLTADTLEDRDYSALLSGIRQTADVLVGAEPLEPERDFDGWPSLTSARARALLAANPKVALHVGPPGSGHGYGTLEEGRRAVGALVLKALHAAARDLQAQGAAPASP